MVNLRKYFPPNSIFQHKTSCCSWYRVKENILLLLTQLVSLIFLIGTLYGILGNDVLPGTEIFALLLLAISAYGGGVLAGLIRLPPLVGMLVVGILYRNLSFIPYQKNISIMWASTLREISLVVILLKAGLALDPKKLKEMKLDVFKLSFIPCLFEAATSAVFIHFLLDLPWLWAFMLGFILCAVSAAVLVPGMLVLEQKGLGTESGIPTLVMASLSVDNVVALTGFVVTFSTITSDESLIWTLVKRPVELIIGLTLGALIGLLLWYLPSRNSDSKSSILYYRSLMLILGGLGLNFLCKRFGMTGAGALGCVGLAFVAALWWRNDVQLFKNITSVTGIFWSLIEAFLFGLIGSEVTIESLGNNIGYSLLVLVLGGIIRYLSTMFALFGSKLSIKEKAFVSATWLAKATVQAAVGSQALDYARTENKNVQFVEYSKQVLTMSVLSIIVTAPLGAIFIEHLAPILLTESGNSTDTSQNSFEIFEDERECIAEVTVTDYGSSNNLTNSRKFDGLIKGLKSNANALQ
ncbi:hypothetical protein JTE90_005864 [Oedothorax gibbosus]|uniref:Cation/H+ exchanger transmembrane domain-containing protein n=1 Tax=Oedothorax gibbosus TaxID=931172 RepID=A0AAV6UR35_9ARAC|nr:hypothetical protein JTE90_005864 [Oedothorax gibbosus]